MRPLRRFDDARTVIAVNQNRRIGFFLTYGEK